MHDDSFHQTKATFPLDDLIQHFSFYKGIGQKTAQRLALETIMLSPEKVQMFASSLVESKKNIKFCSDCYYLTWETKCHICLDQSRRRDTVCVVSEPKDVLSIEQSKSYRGLFHVLGGVISPLDGMYPELLRFKELQERISNGGITDVILALNPTVEGDTTSLYLQELFSHSPVTIYKLAQGIPIGSDLAYLDEVTIDKAFEGKQKL
ncbi:recombination protein RecR [Candidatus Marinamargulisbacteria bacterium SCGC AG-343-K17]|nr:recombination protein RecR [Candidatus Marinamargulisbacteria bacterium SCGC AG-343-K17]